MIFGQQQQAACLAPKPVITPGSPVVDYYCDPNYGTWQPRIRITKPLPTEPAPAPVPAPAVSPPPPSPSVPAPRPASPKPAPVPVSVMPPRWHLVAALLALPVAAVIAGIAAAATDDDRMFAGGWRR